MGLAVFQIFPSAIGLGSDTRQTIDGSANLEMKFWGVDDGLPSTFIRKIIQSEDGFLWIATKTGVARFDGNHFTLIANPNGEDQAPLSALCLAEEPGVGIWIGTTQGVYLFDGVETHSPLSSGAANNLSIRCLAADSTSGVWAGTDQGLTRFKHTKTGIQAVEEIEELRSIHVNDCAVDREGGLWVAAVDGVRRRLPGASQMGPPTGPEPRDRFPVAMRMVVSPEGSAIALFGYETLGGTMFFLDGSSWKYYSGLPRGASILALCKTGDTEVYFAHAGGFSEFREQESTEVHYKVPAKAANLWIESILQDNNGDFWMGLNHYGLVGMLKKSITSVDETNLTDRTPIWTVNQARDGTVWVGHETGVSSYRDGEWTHYKSRIQSGPTSTRSLLCAKSGIVWAGGVNSLRVSHTDTQSDIRDFREVQVGGVTFLFEDSRDNVWVGGTSGLTVFRGGDVNSAEHSAREPAEEALAICETSDGEIWTSGSSGSILRWNPDQPFESTSFEFGLPGPCFQLLCDSTGMIWALTETGVFVYRKATSRFDKFVYSSNPIAPLEILEDPSQQLWIADAQGLTAIPREGIEYAVINGTTPVGVRRLTSTDGAPRLGFVGRSGAPTACVMADSTLWWPSRSGLCRVDPRRMRTMQIPKIVIDGIKTDGLAITRHLGKGNWADTVELPPGSGRHFAIELACGNLRDNPGLRFQFRRLSNSERWIEIGGQREVPFVGLRPGRHLIEFRAQTRSGLWTPSATAIEIAIKPHFYETTEFLVSLVAAGLIGLGILSRWRLSYLRQIEKLEERNRLARGLHDSLGSELADLSHSIAGLSGPEVFPPGSPSTNGVKSESQINGLHASMQRLLDAIREQVWALEPSDLSLNGLFMRVADRGQSLVERAGLRCRLLFPRDFPSAELDWTTRHHVFLAAKEAITNAVRHSGGSTVRIEFETTTREAMVRIIDDGSGFNPGLATEPGQHVGNGLKNIPWRMERISGEARVRASKDKGVHVELRFPLKKRRPWLKWKQ